MRATPCAGARALAAPTRRVAPRPATPACRATPASDSLSGSIFSVLPPAAALWLAAGGPAAAADAVGSGGFAKESYYVTLGLFLLSLPGEWCV